MRKVRTFLRRFIPKRLRKRINAILGRNNLDEVDMAHDFFRKKRKPGTMVDVGAHLGGSLEDFASDGWTVYAFEPDPENLKILEKVCSRFPTVHVESVAVSNREEKDVAFFTSTVSRGISGMLPFHDTHEERARVGTTTLSAFLRSREVDSVQFLKSDTEGYDLFVLQGFPWELMLPEVVLCEFEDRKTMKLGYDFHALAQFLVDKGYRLLVSEWYPIVEYAARHRWRRFVPYPCELADRNAWGNILAAKDGEDFSEILRIADRYKENFS